LAISGEVWRSGANRNFHICLERRDLTRSGGSRRRCQNGLKVRSLGVHLPPKQVCRAGPKRLQTFSATQHTYKLATQQVAGCRLQDGVASLGRGWTESDGNDLARHAVCWAWARGRAMLSLVRISVPSTSDGRAQLDAIRNPSLACLRSQKGIAAHWRSSR
jgi:hypothetical protein